MNEKELAGEIAKRTGVPEDEARVVLEALHQLSSEGKVEDPALAEPGGPPDNPATARLETGRTARSVDELISCARSHPLGLEFLRRGYLGSVAAEFGVTAFAVEEAREKLQKDSKCAMTQEVKA